MANLSFPLTTTKAAAATLEQSASQARIFESNERSILSKHSMKQGANGWSGVEAYGSVTRTCDLELPRGHVSVKCGMAICSRMVDNFSL